MAEKYEHYYVPAQSPWPIVGSVGLCVFVVGAIGLFQSKGWGTAVLIAGTIILTVMMYGWFSNVIEESDKGLYSKQMDRSFRWGMAWFIFSEVMFFAAFFGALYYARILSVPWLGGASNNAATHELLWKGFEATWPLLNNPDPKVFSNTNEAMGAWGLPAINTLILLTSGVTITYAHHALKKLNRSGLILGLFLTVALGVSFIVLQGYEYHHAYAELNLKLSTGIYGTTFFMLTGFHGAHVTIGSIMLFVMLLRAMKGHFTPEKHFAFEATAWYWHFVDVVWLFLFIFVYWL